VSIYFKNESKILSIVCLSCIIQCFPEKIEKPVIHFMAGNYAVKQKHLLHLLDIFGKSSRHVNVRVNVTGRIAGCRYLKRTLIIVN